ncbi:hypothetical protein K523DRAFT_325625 [Schizophyllum commune Tattone D]|nr:hypothetical protein K523DRAFT_325625 [Schizophyllum commune Tattone D]
MAKKTRSTERPSSAHRFFCTRRVCHHRKIGCLSLGGGLTIPDRALSSQSLADQTTSTWCQ